MFNEQTSLEDIVISPRSEISDMSESNRGSKIYSKILQDIFEKNVK